MCWAVASGAAALQAWMLWSYGATSQGPLLEAVVAAAALGLLALLVAVRPARLGVVYWGVGAVAALGVLLLPTVRAEGWSVLLLGWVFFGLPALLSSEVPESGRIAAIARALVVVVCLFGVAEAVAGVLQGRGLLPINFVHGVTGTYVSPNHFAGLIVLTCLTAIGVLAGFAAGAAAAPVRRVAAALLAAAVVPLLGAAVFASRSRGGLLALTAGALILITLLAARSRTGEALVSAASRRLAERRITATLPAALLLGAAVAATAVALHAEGRKLGGRPALWSDSLRLIADHPLLGVGPRTFRWRFTPYQSENFDDRYDFVHNDFLQAAVDYGVPLAIAFWAFVTWQLASCARRARGSSPEAPWMLGLAAGIGAVWVHSLVDFNLQIPGTWTVFCLMLGVVWWSRSQRTQRRPDRPGRDRPTRGGAWIVAAVALLVAAAGARSAARWQALEIATQSAGRDELERALRLDPGNAAIGLRLGETLLAAGEIDAALGVLAAAERAHPEAWTVVFARARALERAGQLDAAELRYRHAEALLPRIGAAPRYRFEVALFLARRGEIAASRAMLERALEIDRDLRREAFELLLLADPSAGLLRRVWPESRALQLALVDLAVAAEPVRRPAVGDDAARSAPGGVLAALVAERLEPLLVDPQVELAELRGAFAWLLREGPVERAVEAWRRATAARGLVDPGWPEQHLAWDPELRCDAASGVGFARGLERGVDASWAGAGGRHDGLLLSTDRPRRLLRQPVVLPRGRGARMVIEWSSRQSAAGLRLVLRTSGGDQVVAEVEPGRSEIDLGPALAGSGDVWALAELRLEALLATADSPADPWSGVVSRLAVLPVGSGPTLAVDETPLAHDPSGDP
ncbi:MAG: hypothetical protein DWQ36_09780 [Acidobacteria bacterium]|nr:MAG: hypothetical protein DWQ30_01060 [Acidobacteriota bacterium]REK08350.1 MAG: hypothetical protein DWQ36_09780 [Acidobacteriota bacterium]